MCAAGAGLRGRAPGRDNRWPCLFVAQRCDACMVPKHCTRCATNTRMLRWQRARPLADEHLAQGPPRHDAVRGIGPAGEDAHFQQAEGKADGAVRPSRSGSESAGASQVAVLATGSDHLVTFEVADGRERKAQATHAHEAVPSGWQITIGIAQTLVAGFISPQANSQADQA